MTKRDEYISGLRQLADWLEQTPDAVTPVHVTDIGVPLINNPAVEAYAATVGIDVAYDEDGNASARMPFGSVTYYAYGYADWDQHLAQHNEEQARSWADKHGMQILPAGPEGEDEV